MKMTIRTRLLACLAALAVGMMAIGVSGLVSNALMGRANHAIMVDRLEPMQQLKMVSDMYAVNIVDTAHKARARTLTADQALASIDSAKAKIRDNWEAYRATRMTPGEQTLVDKASAAMPAADAAVTRLEGIIKSGDPAVLATFNDSALYPAIDPVTANVGALVDLQTSVAHQESKAAAGVARIAMFAMIAIALVTIGVLAFATNVEPPPRPPSPRSI
jgi:methyl-accepting chemotaxis protein